MFSKWDTPIALYSACLLGFFIFTAKVTIKKYCSHFNAHFWCDGYAYLIVPVPQKMVNVNMSQHLFVIIWMPRKTNVEVKIYNWSKILASLDTNLLYPKLRFSAIPDFLELNPFVLHYMLLFLKHILIFCENYVQMLTNNP